MKRQLNFELLRIMSMIMIVTQHFLSHGGVTDTLVFGSMSHIIFQFIRALSYVGVNCFVLISGWFLCESESKISKVIKFESQILFYSLFGTVLYLIVFDGKMNLSILISTIFPVISGKYWFATQYVLLIFLYPLFNYAIRGMNKRQHINSIYVLFGVFSVVPTIFFWTKNNFSAGKDIIWFAVLYFVAAYIRKYNIKLSARKALVGYLLCSGCTLILEMGVLACCNSILGKTPSKIFFYNNAPCIMIGSIMLFLFFKDMAVVNEQKIGRVIVWMSSATLGVYLLHDNDLIRAKLWNIIQAPELVSDNVVVALCNMIIVIFIIFMVGVIFEHLRVFIFRMLYIDKWLEHVIKYFKDDCK